MSQTETRNHKVKCHFGINDYYKHYSTIVNDPKDEKTYKNVLNDYLKANKNAISNFGYSYTLPERLGRIEIRKLKKQVTVSKDGKIINKLPINWKETKKLWKENAKAKEKKILIRYTNEHTNGYVFKIVYLKYLANYKNKSIYKMQINREMRRNTKTSILGKRLDAFLLNSN